MFKKILPTYKSLGKAYQNPYQNEPIKQQNRVVQNGRTTLFKPLKLLHFFIFNIIVFFVVSPWGSRGRWFESSHSDQKSYGI